MTKVSPSVLANTAVTPGTYGGGGNTAVITVDGQGRLTYAANTSSGSTITDDTSTSTTQYLTMARATSGSFSTAYVSSTKLYFDPATGTLSSTIYNTLSDVTFKDNVTPIQGAVATVNQLNGVSFTWKENGNKSYGVIAQELEQVLPDLVDSSNDVKTVNYLGIIAFLINSVKELDERVKQLENK